MGSDDLAVGCYSPLEFTGPLFGLFHNPVQLLQHLARILFQHPQGEGHPSLGLIHIDDNSFDALAWFEQIR